MDSCLGFEGWYYDLIQDQALSLSVDCLTLKMTAPLATETSVTYRRGGIKSHKTSVFSYIFFQ